MGAQRSPGESLTYLIRLVEDHPDLVVLTLQGLDGLGELVRDVQLVGVEQQDDPVHSLPKPSQNLRKVVTWRQKDRIKEFCGSVSDEEVIILVFLQNIKPGDLETDKKLACCLEPGLGLRPGLRPGLGLALGIGLDLGLVLESETRSGSVINVCEVISECSYS